MKSWGIIITLLGSTTVLLLGFIATQLLQKPATDPEAQAAPAARILETSGLPEAPVAPAAADDRLEIQRIELERERLAVETLRLKAQIQSDLAQFELALRAQSTDTAEEVANAGDPATDNLADDEPPSMQKFEPDPIAFEEFREPLEPFGDWIESADYGAVWSPNSSDIDDGWAPYTNGSWGHSDYGWSWVSSEPFGWACYHYGRWIRLGGRGWCWVPGPDWAPAWVSWRTCDSHIAWAPLPPSARWNHGLGIGSWVDAYCGIGPSSYCFVERANFGAPDCRRVLVDRKNNVDLIRRSKNVTRLSSSDRFVHNHGPDFDRACKLSSRPIKRLKIDPTKPEGNRKGIAARRGVGVKIHPALQKLDRTKPDRGWGGLAKQKGDLLRLRQQMVAEARGALIGRVKIKSDVIARAKNGIPTAIPIASAKALSNRKVIAKVEARPKTPLRAKSQQVGKQAPAPTKVSPQVNEKPKAVAAVAKTPKAPARAFDPKPTTLPAVERQKSDTAAAQARAQIAQARQAEERAAPVALAEQAAQRKREQAEAAMLARRKAEAAEQTAHERQKVRDEQERVAAVHAKRDRERKIIAENEASAERARKSAEAQREAIARQTRAANEEQARRKAEDDARRRRDDQRRKAVAAREQEDRRRKVEADRKRQEQVAKDRKAAEGRRDDERRKARTREDQRRKTTEDTRRKKAADAARAQESQKQRARDDQRRKAADDSRRKQAADAARAQEAQKQRARQKQVDDARQKQRSPDRSKSKGR